MKTLTNKDEQVCSACGRSDCASFMAILKENKMEEKTTIEEIKEIIEILKKEQGVIKEISFVGTTGAIKIVAI